MRRAVALAFAVLVTAVPATAGAATFTVDTTDDTAAGTPCAASCSLRSAVEAAALSDGPDTVAVPPGMYTLVNGQLAVGDDLTIVGDEAAPPTINGNDATRLLDVAASGVLTVRFLTLTNGMVIGGTVTGGAIRGATGAVLRVESSTISSSGVSGTAALGGAIYADGPLTIGRAAGSTRDSMLLTNSAFIASLSASGGAVYALTGPTTITHTTLMGNTVTSSGTGGYGGAVVVGSGDLTLADVTADANSLVMSGTASSANGGAIAFVGSGTLTADRLTMTDNVVAAQHGNGIVGGAFGGALFTNTTGSATIRDSVFAANTVTTVGSAQSGAAGGAIASDTPLAISGSTIRDNTATGPSVSGGGLAYSGQSTAIDRTTFSGNLARSNGPGAASGGGIGAWFTSGNPGPLTIAESTFSDNRAQLSGGMLALGAGIAVGSATTISSSTIAGNAIVGASDPSSGGSAIAQATQDALTITASIVAGNTGGRGQCVKDRPVASGGYNVLGASFGCAVNAGPGDAAGVADPLLGGLADNGGPTRTRLPLAGSPAANRVPAGAGDCAEASVDQRGLPRLLGGSCDAGAVETALLPPAAPPPVVTTPEPPATPTTPTAPVTPPPTAKPKSPREQLLSCSGREVTILDIRVASGKATVRGLTVAARQGQTVTLSAEGKRLGTAKVGATGEFTAAVKVPKTKGRARIVAAVGGKKSLAFALERKFVVLERVRAGKRVRVTARIAGGKRGTTVTLRRQVSCKQTERYGTAKLGRDGTFTIALPLPTAAEEIVLYRAVAPIPGGSTFTLPIAVTTGG